MKRANVQFVAKPITNADKTPPHHSAFMKTPEVGGRSFGYSPAVRTALQDLRLASPPVPLYQVTPGETEPGTSSFCLNRVGPTGRGGQCATLCLLRRSMPADARACDPRLVQRHARRGRDLQREGTT